MQSRLRSKTAWIAVLALIIFVSKTYFNLEIPQADTLVNLILVCASAVGIFNNPTDAEKF